MPEAHARLKCDEEHVLDVANGLLKSWGLETVLQDNRYASAARVFAQRYAGFEPQRAIARAVERIEAVLAT